MQQSCPYGSVRGAAGDRRPYRDEGVHGLVAAPSRRLLIRSLARTELLYYSAAHGHGNSSESAGTNSGVSPNGPAS
jgi:hypothetical protein